jgi:hypothetical protein
MSKLQRYWPNVLGEHWVYVVAAFNRTVIVGLLYTLSAPIRFGLW